MAQPKYIVKVRHSPRLPGWAVQADELHVRHPRVEYVKSSSTVGGIPVRHMGYIEGKFHKDRFAIYVKGNGPAGMNSDGRTECQASAEGVKGTVRLLREREAAELDQIDTEILELRHRIEGARTRRKETVKRAWSNGNVVRLAELETLAAVEVGE